MTGVLRKGTFGQRERHAHRRPCDAEGKRCIYTPRNPKDAGKPLEAREGAGAECPSQPREEPARPTWQSWTPASRLQDETFLLCKPPSLWDFVTAAPGHYYMYIHAQNACLLNTYEKYKNCKEENNPTSQGCTLFGIGPSIFLPRVWVPSLVYTAHFSCKILSLFSHVIKCSLKWFYNILSNS